MKVQKVTFMSQVPLFLHHSKCSYWMQLRGTVLISVTFVNYTTSSRHFPKPLVICCVLTSIEMKNKLSGHLSILYFIHYVNKYIRFENHHIPYDAESCLLTL